MNEVSGSTMRYELIGPDGRARPSAIPGTLGGHRRSRIYGRLDCRSALRAIARGGYTANRVFFATAADAASAGYRPCAVCLPYEHRLWKAQRRLQSITTPAPTLQTQVQTLVRLAAARNALTVSLGGGRDPDNVAALDAFEAAWNARGGYIESRVGWPARAASFNRPVRRLTAPAPDLWVIADVPAGWAPVAQRLAVGAAWSPDRTLGFAGLDHLDTVLLAGTDVLDGMTGTTATGGLWWIRGDMLHHRRHPTLLTAP